MKDMMQMVFEGSRIRKQPHEEMLRYTNAEHKYHAKMKGARNELKAGNRFEATERFIEAASAAEDGKLPSVWVRDAITQAFELLEARHSPLAEERLKVLKAHYAGVLDQPDQRN